jgi:hypothetical protein
MILAFTEAALKYVQEGAAAEEVQLALLFVAADGAIGSGADEDAFTLLAAVTFQSAQAPDQRGDDLGERIRAYLARRRSV